MARAVPQCFAAGTLVHTEYGLRPIEEIEDGDLVWSRDEQTGEQSLQPVVRTFETPDQPLVDLQIERQDGSFEALRVTEDHPFFVQDVGWKPAGELDSNEVLYDIDFAYVAQQRDTRPGASASVFNLEVAGLHTYFVGERGTWVHNTCSPWQPKPQ